MDVQELSLEWIQENLSYIEDQLNDNIEVIFENNRYVLEQDGIYKWIGITDYNNVDVVWDVPEDWEINEAETLILDRDNILLIFENWIKNHKQWY